MVMAVYSDDVRLIRSSSVLFRKNMSMFIIQILKKVKITMRVYNDKREF